MVDIQLSFSFLGVEMKDWKHSFCSAKLQLAGRSG